MEYYIMQIYSQAKKNNSEVEQGFEQHSKGMKYFVLISLGVIIGAFVLTIISAVVLSEIIYPIIAMLICILLMFTVFILDKIDERKHLEKYAKSYETKLGILDKLLREDYGISSKEKLEELIAMYQKVVDKKKEDESRQIRFITIILSAFAAVLSISFTNLEVIGIDFQGWLALAIALAIIIGLVTSVMYVFTYYDSIKKKYEMMIKDLEELRLRKY